MTATVKKAANTFTLALLFLLTLGLTPYAWTATVNTLDKIAAVVDDDVIMLTDVQGRARQLKRQQGYTNLPDKALLKEALEQLILDSLQIQKARQIGLSVSDVALNASMEKIAHQNQLTLLQLQQALKQQGLHYPTFREKIRQRLLINELRKRQLQRNTKITNQEVSDLIANQSSVLSKGIEFKIQHHTVPAPAGTPLADLLKAKEKAEKLRAQLLKDRDTRSENTTVGATWVKSSELPATHLRHIALLEKGETSDVFQDPKGFHIIKLIDKKGVKKVLIDEIHARHILLKTDSTTTDTMVKSHLDELRNQILAGADFADLAKRYSQDPGSASSGGDLGWATPENYVPAFANVLKNTPENTISKPFKSKFGWHILQVLERKTLDKTEGVLRQQAKGLLNKNKAQKEYERWVKQLRNDAFVEYRIKL